MASKRRELGQLSPRLLEISAKTTAVEPYPVTDKIVIRQTRQRRDELSDSYTEFTSCQNKLQKLVKQADALPEPEAPGDDATAEQADAYGVARAAYDEQIAALQLQADDLGEKISAAGHRYERVFFGDVYDDIMELSADWDPAFYEAFKADINEHFQQGVNPPPDGTDETGVVVDPEEAGKALRPST